MREKAPPNMIARLEPESVVPAPANRTAPVPDDRTMSFPEITFDIFSFLDENQPGVDLLQSLLDAPPASVPAVVPPPAPVAAASQTSSGSQTVASRQQRTKLLTLRRLVTQLPRLPLSALPPGVTYEAATQVMLYYAVSQERSKIDGNILIHKLAKANNSAELARYTDLMIGFKHKTHLHTKNRHGETPLHVVTGPESARVLLERGAHLDARDMLGNTPIHLAARYQRVEVLAVLLEGTPEYSLLDMKNLEGYTALHLVVIHQPVADPHRRALQLLIDSGLDVNVADDTGGRSPLFHAVLRGDELAVRELVENNAAVNMADFSETTPLQAAEDVLPADNNHICSILLERGGFKVAPADRVTQTGRRGPRRKAV